MGEAAATMTSVSGGRHQRMGSQWGLLPRRHEPHIIASLSEAISPSTMPRRAYLMKYDGETSLWCEEGSPSRNGKSPTRSGNQAFSGEHARTAHICKEIRADASRPPSLLMGGTWAEVVAVVRLAKKATRISELEDGSCSSSGLSMTLWDVHSGYKISVRASDHSLLPLLCSMCYILVLPTHNYTSVGGRGCMAFSPEPRTSVCRFVPDSS